MGSKKVLPTYNLFTNAVMTGTTTLISTPTIVSNLDNIYLQIGWTGTAVGTITIEVSPDNIDYDALTFSPLITQPNNNATRYSVSLNQLPAPYLRVKYVNSSGTGTLTVKIFAKDIN